MSTLTSDCGKHCGTITTGKVTHTRHCECPECHGYEAPVRLCCGKRHYGKVCPDSMVMCCICFTRVKLADCYVDQNGITWDMCRECGKAEEAVANV